MSNEIASLVAWVMVDTSVLLVVGFVIYMHLKGGSRNG